ncbi:amino acid deaminase/aldolase [Paludibacterium paludis]|uniref:amino acid deaminase/aldolase n=1 Tax=Paludibacterium paludis TaxID=1225769 RepID=UPI001C054BB6|nr:amino acid deaminase/aldolase [Paludibacterium paludis]
MTSRSLYETYAEALGASPLPLAFVDLDVFDANARAMAERTSGKPIRVAGKSVRCRALLERVLCAQHGMKGVLCFHPDEAVFLFGKGLDDFLVAYPSLRQDSLRRVAEAVARGATIRLMVDHLAQAKLADRIARDAGVILPLCMDIDMSLSLPGLHAGVRRSPLSDETRALALYREIARLRHVRLEGVMGYEAQVAGVGDAQPGRPARNALVRFCKRLSRSLARERRARVVAALREAGAPVTLVNGGGSGSLASTAADPCVTEIGAGSGLFAPHLFDAYREAVWRPAAGFVLEVARIPGPGFVTCGGGGYVASGPSAPDRLPRPWLPEGLALLPLEGAGEVQTPLSGDVGGLEPGDKVFFRHAKAGELCERFNELVLIQAGKVVGRVPTYRGEGMQFM